MIVAANAAVLALGLIRHWSLLIVMITYWLQSAAIGWYGGRRILLLADRKALLIFLVHYGLFAFLFLLFLIIAVAHGRLGSLDVPDVTGGDMAWIASSGLLFALTHGFSFRRNRKHDLEGRPSVEMLMLLPYIRVVPMHLTFLCGLAMGANGALLVFGLLKTVADVVMHWAQHRILASVQSTP